MNDVRQPLVSICIITYNQEKYIDDCIKSVLAQEIDFSCEIIIGEDCSTDATKSIVEKYSDVSNLRLLPAEKSNLGMLKNWHRTISAAKGKYIALIEGDDFWENTGKLKKQVDFLEKNPETGLSFTDASVINELDNRVYSSYIHYPLDEYPSLKLLLENNFIPTCTVVFRKNVINNFPPEFFKSPYADWFTYLLCAEKSQIHYLCDITSCYRLHAGGIYSSSNEEERIKRRLEFYNLIIKYYSDNRTLYGEIRLLSKKQIEKLHKYYITSGQRLKALLVNFKIIFGIY